MTDWTSRLAVMASVVLITTGTATGEEAPRWTPDILLTPKSPGSEEAYYAQRRFPFNIPQDGLYEIEYPGCPQYLTIWLDGLQIIHKHESHPPLDSRGYLRTVRPLAAGHHVIEARLNQGGHISLNHSALIRIGLTRTTAADPARSLAVYPKDRDDLVFRRGEPLVIAIDQYTDDAIDYSVTVVEQRGTGEPLWRKTVRLTGSAAWAHGETRYVCEREGAFEYTVRDASERIVDGPWAFVVVDPTPLPLPRRTPQAPGRTEARIPVDKVDCTLDHDEGHAFRDNGTSTVVNGSAGPYRVTGTAKGKRYRYVKDNGTLRRAKGNEKGEDFGRPNFGQAWDWFAYTLTVRNPGRAHLLTGWVPNDQRRLVSIYAIDQVTGMFNGWNLDAGGAPEAGDFSPLSFFVWPNSSKLDVVVWCSNGNHGSTDNRQGAVRNIELYELPDGPPPLLEAFGGWSPPNRAEFGWNGEQVDLGIFERTMPSLWPGDALLPGMLPHSVVRQRAWYHDWRALWTACDRWGRFSRYRGDNLMVMPVHTYEMNLIQGPAQQMLNRSTDVYATGYRFRNVDRFDRDIFKLVLLTAEKYGTRVVADFMVQRMSERVEYLAQRAGCSTDGILLSESPDGKPAIIYSHIMTLLNPAHPVARQYMVDLMAAMGERYGRYPAFAGVNTRFWQGWPSAMDGWFLDDRKGCDDYTVGRFAEDLGIDLPMAKGDAAIYEARRKALYSTHRKEWTAWRCRQVLTLRQEMLAALQRHAPQARLYSDAGLNPGVERSCGLDRELLGRVPGLGFGREASIRYNARKGVEWNYLDPVAFAAFDQREPKSVRFDLAKVSRDPTLRRVYPPGMVCNESTRPHPYQLEKPAKALADGKLDVCLFGGEWCLPPADEGMRHFVQAWRAIPPLVYSRVETASGNLGPFACWESATADGDLVVYLVNRTPRELQAELTFDKALRKGIDLVSGQAQTPGATLRATLAPFMPGVYRIEGPAAVREAKSPVSAERLATLGNEMTHLRSLRPRALGARQVINGGLRPDEVFSFDELFAPLDAAWQTGDFHAVSRLIDTFHARHTWWYEAFGWPADFYAPRKAKGTQATSGGNFRDRIKPGSKARLTGVSGHRGAFVVAPKDDRVTVVMNPWGAGRAELRAWGLFGGGYGPVRVEYRGETLGFLGGQEDTVRRVHHVLPVPLAWPWSPQKFTLIGEGEKGLALSHLELQMLPPTPIRLWQLIGLFDKGSGVDEWENMEKVFPPERKIDLAATYPGLGGAPASWRKVDLGEAKTVQLLEYFPDYNPGRGDGVAYLATWIHSPRYRRENENSQLYFAMDWYGKAWMNGKLVLPKIRGPKHYKSIPVELKQGWNCLLVKTAAGRDGWTAAFAISDPGDLIFRAAPKGPAVAPAKN